MLKLTKKTDYALMAINYMAYRKEGFLANTRNISETYHIPLEQLAKILQTLSKNGIIVSHNGPKGGYTLGVDPEQFTLGEVIRAIEGPIQMIRCIEGESSCSQTEQCTIRTPLIKIEQQLVDFLDNITIDTICNENEAIDQKKAIRGLSNISP